MSLPVTESIEGNKPSVLPAPDWADLVRTKVDGLRYGVVQIVVHDGKVTQIECTEKTRIVTPRES